MVAEKSSDKVPEIKLVNVVESGSRKITYDDSLTPYINVLRDSFKEASGKTEEERREILARALEKLMSLRRNGASKASSGESVDEFDDRIRGHNYMLF